MSLVVHKEVAALLDRAIGISDEWTPSDVENQNRNNL